MAASNPNDMLGLIIAVKQTNLAQLEETLMDVSDPRSEHYGHHLRHL
jgi:hypothetical protein